MKPLLKAARNTLTTHFAILCIALVLFSSRFSYAQLFTFPKQDLIDYTASSPFERFADGRPKLPDALMERARGLSAEEVWETLGEGF